jgi:predicted trehalose synthase
MPQPLGSISKDIRTIGKALVSIGLTLGRSKTRPAMPQRAPLERPHPTTRRLTAKRRAALKLQGRYMGHMRQLRPRQKALVRAQREAKGLHAAIALARRLAKIRSSI